MFKHSRDTESVETLNDWEWPTDPDWGICWTISILTLPNLIQRWVAARCVCNNHHVLCCSIRSLLRGVKSNRQEEVMFRKGGRGKKQSWQRNQLWSRSSFLTTSGLQKQFLSLISNADGIKNSTSFCHCWWSHQKKWKFEMMVLFILHFLSHNSNPKSENDPTQFSNEFGPVHE